MQQVEEMFLHRFISVSLSREVRSPVPMSARRTWVCSGGTSAPSSCRLSPSRDWHWHWGPGRLSLRLSLCQCETVTMPVWDCHYASASVPVGDSDCGVARLRWARGLTATHYPPLDNTRWNTTWSSAKLHYTILHYTILHSIILEETLHGALLNFTTLDYNG